MHNPSLKFRKRLSALRVPAFRPSTGLTLVVQPMSMSMSASLFKAKTRGDLKLKLKLKEGGPRGKAVGIFDRIRIEHDNQTLRKALTQLSLQNIRSHPPTPSSHSAAISCGPSATESPSSRSAAQVPLATTRPPPTTRANVEVFNRTVRFSQRNFQTRRPIEAVPGDACVRALTSPRFTQRQVRKLVPNLMPQSPPPLHRGKVEMKVEMQVGTDCSRSSRQERRERTARLTSRPLGLRVSPRGPAVPLTPMGALRMNTRATHRKNVPPPLNVKPEIVTEASRKRLAIASSLQVPPQTRAQTVAKQKVDIAINTDEGAEPLPDASRLDDAGDGPSYDGNRNCNSNGNGSRSRSRSLSENLSQANHDGIVRFEQRLV